MADITTFWNVALQRGDWAMAGGDLASGNDLATAVLISLGTDRVAQVGYIAPPPSDNNPRGWWGDAYLPADIGPLGTRLWQLKRAIKTQTTLNTAADMAHEGTGWMIRRGIVSRFDINPYWANGSFLAMTMLAHRPNGAQQALPAPGVAYAWVWL